MGEKFTLHFQRHHKPNLTFFFFKHRCFVKSIILENINQSIKEIVGFLESFEMQLAAVVMCEPICQLWSYSHRTSSLSQTEMGCRPRVPGLWERVGVAGSWVCIPHRASSVGAPHQRAQTVPSFPSSPMSGLEQDQVSQSIKVMACLSAPNLLQVALLSMWLR